MLFAAGSRRSMERGLLADGEMEAEKGLRGHCYAIRHDTEYVGVILIGEAIEDEADPVELRGTGYFRIIGFVLDKEHRSQGIGSQALRLALDELYCEYGRVPILLECHRENVKAMNFYTKMGFRNTHIPHMDDVYFVKY